MVHGVGVVLALYRHAVVVGIAASRLGFGASACEPVARVNHHAGLRRKHLHRTARLSLAQFADLAQDVGFPVVYYEGMVVPLEIADVVELRVDTGAERPELRKVLRRAGSVQQFACGNLLVVHFQHLRAVEPQFVVEDRPAAVAREVEIDVVGEVHDRRPVGLGQIGDFQCVVVVEIEDGLHAHFAGIALVAVLRHEGHHHAVGLYAALPDAVGKSLRAAVQVVHAVVDLQPVLLAFDGHLPEGDAVGAPAHAFARSGSVEEIAFGMFVTQHHVGHAALAVGHLHRNDCGAVVRELHLGSRVVAQRVEDDRLAFRGHAPDVLFDFYHFILQVLSWSAGCRYASGTLPCR